MTHQNTPVTITALLDGLAATVQDYGISSAEVSGMCDYIKNGADISAADYETLNSQQKNLLNNACQYTGPVEMAS